MADDQKQNVDNSPGGEKECKSCDWNSCMDEVSKRCKSLTMAEAVALVVLLIGVIFSLPIWVGVKWIFGNLVVGIIAGMYLLDNPKKDYKGVKGFLCRQGTFRGLVIIGFGIGLLCNAFWLAIGGAVGFAIKTVLDVSEEVD